MKTDQAGAVRGAGSAINARLSPPSGGFFYLYGPESFLREALIRRITDAHVDASTRDFNLDQLRGDAGVDQLASVAATLPMMADFRVLIIRDAHLLMARAEGRDWLEAIGDPRGLALVLAGEEPTGAAAKRCHDLLCKRAIPVACVTPGVDDIPGWIIQHARDTHDRLIEGEAAVALAARYPGGAPLGLFEQEVAKLVAFVTADRAITGADVDAVSGNRPAADRWRWFDAVSEREFRAARLALPALLSQGETAPALVSGLATQLLRLGLAIEAGVKGLEEALPPNQRWLARKIPGQARRWNAGNVRSALALLLEVDRRLKSTATDDLGVMEEVLVRMEAAR